MSSGQFALLTAHLFVSKKNKWNKLNEMLIELRKRGITVKLYGPNDALVIKNPKEPRVYISLGKEWTEFSTLSALPLYERKRWLHFDSPADIQPFKLFHCWLTYTEPLPEIKTIPPTRFTSDTPLVSVFTASYRSKDKIQRPYQSLLKQTYPNWEWVIVDDSGDDDETYQNYLLPLDDPRVRRYRQDKQSGYIGATKRYAAGLCTGEILVEVDHDDDLTPDCLEKIVHAFQEHPECGFAYGDNAEVYVNTHHSHWYGWDCGFGYCMYYRVFVHSMNRWQNVMHQTALNGQTICHLVGLPNHPRAWTRDCYHLIGGHRPELLVADDYDMLVRTFLSTRYVAIPDLLYLQYRNEKGDNSTFQRNEQIQILCQELWNHYYNRIQTRMEELGLPSLENLPYTRIWEAPSDYPGRTTAHIIHKDSSKTSILFPIPYSSRANEHTQLLKTLQEGMETNFKTIEVVVVGNVPPEVEAFAAMAPMGAIRWWPMETDDSPETCLEYAKFCASGSKIEIVLPQCERLDN